MKLLQIRSISETLALIQIRSKYNLGVPKPAASLDPQQLSAYFALMEVSSLLRHAVEQHLRADGDLSYVQFQILARLNDSPTGSYRMTDLADGVVYSRSALTYQAGLLERRGLISRSPSSDDERSVDVTITDAGRALIARVLPGHIEVVSGMLLDPLSRKDLEALTGLLNPVRDHMRSTPPRSAAPRRGKNIDS
jgi:DNA-binding MarR family transcriptional regulator